MAVLRRYVVPVIWMLLLGVIALALAKMAFFPSADASATQDPVTPGAEFDQYALVAAETGAISSTLELTGTVQADEGTPLKATTTGEINKIWRKDGDTVSKGERVLQVRYPVEPAPLPEVAVEPGTGTGDGSDSTADGAEGTADGEAGDAADGADAAAPQPAAPTSTATEYRYVNLVASASGTLTDMEVQEQDDLTEGDVVATLSPGTYSIHTDLTPEQQLSLLDIDLEATATVPTTQDPVACTAPSIEEDAPGDEQPAAEEPADPAEEGLYIEGEPEETGGGTSLAHLACPVPSDVKVVPGLEVEVSVALGSRSDVLTVPTTAVEGEAGTGTVYVLDEGTGEPAPVEVELGLRQDGRVEITGGLEEGQEILEFVPGVDAPNQDEGMVW